MTRHWNGRLFNELNVTNSNFFFFVRTFNKFLFFLKKKNGGVIAKYTWNAPSVLNIQSMTKETPTFRSENKRGATTLFIVFIRSKKWINKLSISFDPQIRGPYLLWQRVVDTFCFHMNTRFASVGYEPGRFIFLAICINGKPHVDWTLADQVYDQSISLLDVPPHIFCMWFRRCFQHTLILFI